MRRLTTDEKAEILLDYLLSLDRDANNEINFGPKRYSKIDGLSKIEVVQSLHVAKERGWCELEFTGPPQN